MALTPLDFPASPTVGQLYPDPPVTGQPTYRWDGAQWLSYAAASLPTPTKPANYGKKNYIINGAMQVSQENGASNLSASAGYPVDGFYASFSHAGAINYGQVAVVTPSGSPNRIRFGVVTPDASVGSTDHFIIIHNFEGLRVADLMCGTAVAKTVTLQFGVKAPAGTYCVFFQNGAANRSYVAEYVIAAGEANTSVIKQVTVPLDQTGTWATDNTQGLRAIWTLMCGVTYQTPPNIWTAGNFLASSNQFNFMGTAGNVFELFDVSLTEGSVAPPFQVPDYASELALCKRYWTPIVGNLRNNGGGVSADCTVSFPAPMRATPTAVWQTGTRQPGGVSVFMTPFNTSYARFEIVSGPAGDTYAVNDVWHASARL